MYLKYLKNTGCRNLVQKFKDCAYKIRNNTHILAVFKDRQKEKAVKEIEIAEEEVRQCLDLLDNNFPEDLNTEELQVFTNEIMEVAKSVNPKKALTIIKDNCTRWNSVRRLIKRLLDTKESINYVTHDAGFNFKENETLLEEDWEAGSILVFFILLILQNNLLDRFVGTFSPCHRYFARR